MAWKMKKKMVSHKNFLICYSLSSKKEFF